VSWGYRLVKIPNSHDDPQDYGFNFGIVTNFGLPDTVAEAAAPWRPTRPGEEMQL